VKEHDGGTSCSDIHGEFAAGAVTTGARSGRCEGQALAIATLIHAHPLFAETDIAATKNLMARGQPMSLQQGDVLLRQGDPSDAAYVVVDGTANVRIDTNYGPTSLSTVAAPTLVGEIGVFMGVPRTATIEAATPLKVLRIAAAELRTFGSENPKFLAAVMRSVGRRFQTFNRAVGFYANALQALRQPDFDARLLEDLNAPLPELTDFAHSFRQLAEEIIARRSHREEMASAAAIQRTMLPPPAIPLMAGTQIDIFAQMSPARDIGGDFYDYFPLDDHHLAITVGDVSGKGVPAVLFMASVQTALRVALRQHKSLSAAISTANDLLVVNNSEAMFTTLFCAVIDVRDGTVVACNCGHPAPLLVSRNGSVERIISSSLPLGLKADARFKAVPLTMHRGDVMLLSTDGLPDAMNAAGEAYGERRLERVITSLDAATAKDYVSGVIGSVMQFADQAPQFDDITALAMIYQGCAADGQ
jgi:sigma-B regulation protein RsbU (phosphoserine phosphatase)